jgi:hypothetical protein
MKIDVRKQTSGAEALFFMNLRTAEAVLFHAPWRHSDHDRGHALTQVRLDFVLMLSLRR